MSLRRLFVPLIAALAAGCSGAAATDAGGLDASFDGAADAADLGRPDAGHDAERDAGYDADDGAEPFECATGEPCPTGACRLGLTCEPPTPGPSTLTLPDCTTGAPVSGRIGPEYTDGYCTTAACDPTRASDDPTMAGADGCEPCAKCAQRMPSIPATCEQRCTPSATDLGGCRSGYTCDVATHTCSPYVCFSDVECETRSDGTLCADTTSGASCNTATGRCQHPGRAGASAGDTCTTNFDCETDGVCLSPAVGSDPGGYCTRFGCDVAGLACGAATDTCQDLGDGDFVCLRKCSVDAEPPSAVLGVGGHGDTCRVGYQCLFDDHSGPGAPGNGGCWSGNYNGVVANNVGSACTNDDECFSPHGAGRCIFTANRSCAILGCAGYPATDDICGSGNTCLVFADRTSACLASCTTAADCASVRAPATSGCLSVALFGPGATGSVCWPGCTSDADCAPPKHCIGVVMTGTAITTLGQCI